MYFNSLAYIFGFLPIVIIVYFILNRIKWIIPGKIWLIIASIVFYAWFNIKYTPFLIGYILLNYVFYYFIKHFQNKKYDKYIWIISILANILILGVFKYYNFFVETVNFVFKSNFSYIDIFLPLAISFQTLQQIGFLTDAYKNKEMSIKFIDYCLFSVFFPQLIIGPIVKYSETIPQFNNLKKKIFNHKNFIMGLFIFLVGFYKKGFIVSCFSEQVFSSIEQIGSMSTLEAWIFSIIEYFHSYLDISSYMDMALGSALMLNIELPINFNSPMIAQNITEFWDRWHISFSRFFKNYVFFPLKALKQKEWFSDFAIIITCFLGGLWQGASICAVVWGFLHGLGFLVHKYWQKFNIKIPNFVSWIITFVFVSFAGMLLRFESLKEMGIFISRLFTYNSFVYEQFEYNRAIILLGNGGIRRWDYLVLLFCFIGLVLVLFKIPIEGKDLVKHVKPNLFWAVVLAGAIVELIYFYAPPTGFLYYNF